MPRYLTSALISEGPTDDRFMGRLLGRLLEDVCGSQFDDFVEVADVQVLRWRRGPAAIPEMLALVDSNPRAFLLVFVHRDQGASAQRTEDVWLRRLREAWGVRTEQLVCVVPVREMEAWALADGDALRRTLGVTWSDRALGVPARAVDVEDIADPKQVLAALEPRFGREVSHYFERLGELVSLERLAQVPAFLHLRQQITDALISIGYR
jgi:hypothetical protein